MGAPFVPQGFESELGILSSKLAEHDGFAGRRVVLHLIGMDPSQIAALGEEHRRVAEELQSEIDGVDPVTVTWARATTALKAYNSL